MNEPPVYVPAYFSMTVAPSVPTLNGNVTVKVADPPPAARVPRLCGNGEPEATPSVAVVTSTLVAGPEPLLVILMVA